jgi:predicted dienelactone hydrolase
MAPWIAALVAAQAARGAEPATPLPAPTGPFAVGRSTYFWTDAARSEPQTDDPQDHRALRVDVWYPAAAGSQEPHAPYFDDLKALGIRASLFRFTKTHARTGAPLAEGTARFPVILVSPGMGSNGFQYTSLVEELVSHGYVVATIDHPFQSWVIVYPDGRKVSVAHTPKEAPSDPAQGLARYRESVAARSADLRFALDQLALLDRGQGDPRFAGRLDLQRVGVLGHSIGGVAAAEACHDDARFRAAANLDGHAASLPFLLDAEGRGPQQPFLEITDGNAQPSDEQLAAAKQSREDVERQLAEIDDRVRAKLQSVAGGSYRVTIPGIKHDSFSDMALWDAEPVDARLRRVNLLRDYLRAFFDKTLRGDRDTLLDAERPPDDAVKVERFAPPARDE